MTAPYYRVKRANPQPPYVMGRLYVVQAKRVRFFDRKSVSGVELGELYRREVFHGVPSDVWIKRLPSEGGGYCVGSIVRELP